MLIYKVLHTNLKSIILLFLLMQFAWQSNGYFQSYTTIYDYNGSLTGYFFISHLAFSFQFSSITLPLSMRSGTAFYSVTN
jgi:hypothetical protein